jgi:DNA repair protein RadC
LLKHGVDVLSDAELLSILIRTARQRMTAVDIARKLLTQFETLDRLSSRTVADVRSASGLGLGLAKAAAIVAAFELGRRAAVPSGEERPKLRSPEDVQINRQLVEAGKIVGIPVHDHIIVAGLSYVSFAERGLI